MSNKRTTFSISNVSNSDTVTISTPLNISYLVDEKFTVDNTNGVIYPNFAIIHKSVYSTISKIDNLIGMSDTGAYTNEALPNYKVFNWNQWHAVGSLVYVYDSDNNYYRFYKSLKMTNPLISLDNSSFWNSYKTAVWSDEEEYEYIKGSIVHTFSDSVYNFYECLKNTSQLTSIDDESYWKLLNLKAWSYDEKYNISSKVHADDMVYTAIKTILPVTQLNNKEYWLPYFNYYALANTSSKVSNGLINKLTSLNVILKQQKAMFEQDTSSFDDTGLSSMYTTMASLNTSILAAWNDYKTTYNNITKSPLSPAYALLWKNIYDADVYFNKLSLYNTDPIQVLESIRYLDSFEDTIVKNNTEVVVYVKNLYEAQDPSQKNGAYFIYDINKKRFIKALVGQHDHRNKEILDEISQSFDEISENDNVSSKVLTVRKEKADNGTSMSWDFHAQWEDMDLIPDKPTDGNEYVLKLGEEGILEWSNKLSSAIAFIKKQTDPLPSDSQTVTFEVELTFDSEGNILDSALIFKNAMYINDFTHNYNQSAKVLTVTTPEGFQENDVITLILIRNTSAEMLSKLSDEYVSKKEAISILSNGSIELTDYIKKEAISKYSLRNHIHTRYAATDHSHWGVYADYYHNHDGLYMTRTQVNEILGNIMSINPDLIDIISSISADAEELNSTFVSKLLYNQYVTATNKRLLDLETIDNKILYIDTNTGQVSKKVNNGVSIDFQPIDIKSYQIQTKYKVSDDPSELEVYNLEDWLDHVLNLIATEELRIKIEIRSILKNDKYLKTYELLVRSSNKNGTDLDAMKLYIKNFMITDVKLSITEPFNNPIAIKLDSQTLIDFDDIIENQISVTNYIASKKIGDYDAEVSFDLSRIGFNDNEGIAVLNITGYTV